VKQPGDTIDIDESVLEIATDKVDSEVPSPVSGKLVKVLFKEDDVVQVGAVIAVIETDANAEIIKDSPQEIKIENVVQVEQIPEAPFVPEPVVQNASNNNKSIDFSSTERFYSPLVKSMAAEEGISIQELNSIIGTGSEGRVTKQDVLDYIQNNKSTATVVAKVQNNASIANEISNQKSVSPVSSVSGGDEIIEMDRMRKLIADHMVMSKHTSAHVTSFVEVDVTNLVKWRDRVKSSFEKREGEKITFTPIFIEAVAKAIKDLPMINISINGTQIIKKRDINIGMAAALPSGNLIVPVIKNADQLNLFGLTKAVNDLANRARQSKLKPDETQGGTFTLTNVGTFGNVMGTPIINQPQVAILAVGAIKKKPAVIETEHGDVIAIRHMMFLSLSYDHRVVDGSLGGSFVRRVADYLENWDINREI
jgi:2-oxoglutarate dehydrogenase E2 component (dihydrolipoamide succinyltransferase)